MAKTAAERQEICRQNRANGKPGHDPEFRLNTWLSSRAHFALARLSHHEGITKREILERLICSEDESITAALELDTPEWNAYFRQS